VPDYTKPSDDPNVLVEPTTNRDGVALGATVETQIFIPGRNPSDGRVDTFDLATLSTAAKQDTAKAVLDAVAASLVAIASSTDGLEGFTDGVEALLTTISGNTDGLEGLVDGLEGLLAALTNGAQQVLDTPPSTGTPANVTSSASSVTLKAANASRRGLYIFNDSSANLYVKFGATASATSFTVKLTAGAFYEMPAPYYRGVVDGIWDSANGSARVTEIV
jgi:hypothetical protein